MSRRGNIRRSMILVCMAFVRCFVFPTYLYVFQSAFSRQMYIHCFQIDFFYRCVTLCNLDRVAVFTYGSRLIASAFMYQVYDWPGCPFHFCLCSRQKARVASHALNVVRFCVFAISVIHFLSICVIFFICFSLACVSSRYFAFSISAACSYPLCAHISFVLFRAEGYICVIESRSSFLAFSQLLSVRWYELYFSLIWFFAKCCATSSGCAPKCFKSYSTSAPVSSNGF